MQQGLLSFDIWDTVLRRKCAPDEDKLAVSKYLVLKKYQDLKEEYRDIFVIDKERKNAELEIAGKNRENGYDDEYTIEAVFTELLQRILVRLPEDLTALVKELTEIEIAHELRITYLEEEAVKVFHKYPELKKVYISDFYLGKPELDRILQKHQDKMPFDNGYVSCDYLLNKKSGRLYELVDQENAVQPQTHIHYGDSMKADIEAAQKKGIQANLMVAEENLNKKKALEKNFALRRQGDVRKYFEFIEQLPQNGAKSPLFWHGQKYSMIFYTFVLEIIETAIQRNAEKVYYFTREGEFFAKIHRKIKESSVFDVEIPDCEVLEVSRMATFAPSLHDFSLEEMKRLWTQYHDQSMISFYKSLNIPIAPYEGYFEKYGIQKEDPIPNITEDERIKKLFADQEYVEKMRTETAAKREALKGYLVSKGVDLAAEELFIVDIGWRGSIQDNIALVLPGTHIFGYYLGLFESFYGDIPNAEKKGFLTNQRTPEYMWCLRFVDPIEMYCNSNSGSTVGYQKTESGYAAVKEKFSSEDSVFQTYTGDFQDGVLDLVPQLCQTVDTFCLVSGECKKVALMKLEEFIGNPEKCLVVPYFALSHNENFGKGAVEQKYRAFNYGLALRACVSKKHLKTFVSTIEETHWPQGFLSFYGFRFLASHYNKRVKVHTKARIEVESDSWCEIAEENFAIVPSNEIQCYLEKALVKANAVDIEGWAVLPKVNSSELQTYLLLESKTDRYLIDTRVVSRKDVTAHFHDGKNYDSSGFVCKINREYIKKGEYNLFIVIKNAEAGYGVLMRENMCL